MEAGTFEWPLSERNPPGSKDASSSVPLNLGSSFLVLKKDPLYKFTVHLHLDVFNEEPTTR